MAQEQLKANTARQSKAEADVSRFINETDHYKVEIQKKKHNSV